MDPNKQEQEKTEAEATVEATVEPAAIRALAKPPKEALPSLDILLSVRQARQANGLRTDDYERYRQYCTRRIRRLRSTVRGGPGKSKVFVKAAEPSSAEVQAHPEHLAVYLACAERAWAYALQLRPYTVDGSDNRTRAYFSMRKRLRAAVEAATVLERLAVRDCDARTALEAALYALWARGNDRMEAGEWAAAREALLCSSALCQLLLRLEGGGAEAGERQSMLQERIDEMAAKLRLCVLSLRRQRVPTDDLEALAETDLVQRLRPDLVPLLEVAVNRRALVAEGVARGSREAALAAQAAGVLWKGVDVPVRSTRVRDALAALRQAMLGVGGGSSAASAATTTSGQEDKEGEKGETETEEEEGARTDAVVAALASATQALKTEEKALAKKAAHSTHAAKPEHQRDNALLQEYVAWMRHTQAVERHLAQAAVAERSMKEFSLGATSTTAAPAAAQTQTQAQTGKKAAKAEDIVRLYDAAVLALDEARALGTPNAAPDAPLEQESKTYAARRLTLRAERMYYLALAHMRRGRWAEADALAVETRKVAADARAHQQDCVAPDQRALQRLETLEQRLRLLRCVVRARAAAGAEAEDQESAADALQSVDDAPDTFSLNPHRALATVPPPLEPMSMRPFLRDVAGARIEYPDLSSRKRKKGFFSSFFG